MPSPHVSGTAPCPATEPGPKVNATFFNDGSTPGEPSESSGARPAQGAGARPAQGAGARPAQGAGVEHAPGVEDRAHVRSASEGSISSRLKQSAVSELPAGGLGTASVSGYSLFEGRAYRGLGESFGEED
jgi:hypothetical protein